MGAPQISETFRRVRRDHVLEDAGKIRVSTRGRPSQVVTAEEAERILQLLPGKRAAAFRIGDKLQPKRARTDSLYVMRYSNDATCVKIGRSDNMEGRQRHLEAGQNFTVDVLVIFPGAGWLEAQLHERLQEKRSSHGAGREWFKILSIEAVALVNQLLPEIELEKSKFAAPN